MARNYPPTGVKKLYGLAAARCAFPECRLVVVLPETSTDGSKQIGKIAHIVAHGKKGPRADATYLPKQLDSYENWILLCPTCHDKIDAQEHTYTVEYLRELKLIHEGWVLNSLDESMANIGFTELEFAAKGIASSSIEATLEFTVIPPSDKIAKNGLSPSVSQLLVMGLSRSNEIQEYITKIAQLDSNFPERLTNGFKEKYHELKSQGLSGDELFTSMHEFSRGGSHDFSIQAAGLAILCHLFEICEVFEK